MLPVAVLSAPNNFRFGSLDSLGWAGKCLSIQAIAEHRNEPVEKVTSRARGVAARAQAIRYVQLGHPEAILIDDGEVLKRLDEEAKAAAAAAASSHTS